MKASVTLTIDFDDNDFISDEQQKLWYEADRDAQEYFIKNFAKEQIEKDGVSELEFKITQLITELPKQK